MNKRKWKSIPGYEGRYECSNDGEVRSLQRIVNSKVGVKREASAKGMVKYLSTDGYWLVYLSINGKTSGHRVARLVAQTFIPNPENKPQVNHKSGIKTDNRVENLEWATRSENMQHAFATGLKKGPKEVYILNIRLKEALEKIANMELGMKDWKYGYIEMKKIASDILASSPYLSRKIRTRSQNTPSPSL